MPSDTKIVVIEGEIALWIDQGAIHLKLQSAAMDPVELSTDTARELATVLIRYADQIDRDDGD